jgi:hypothetical protein
MDEWKRKHIPHYAGDLLLQMDIEGFEYETILNMSIELLLQFRIVVVEIHFIEQWLSKPYFEFVSRAFEKLLQSHSVVHMHPNNAGGTIRSQGLTLPRLMEFTLQRNDRIHSRVPASRFPHPLDTDNTKKPALTLPECWYRQSAEAGSRKRQPRPARRPATTRFR